MKPLYMHFDIISPSNYFKIIETKATKNNTWSMLEVINDLENNELIYKNNFNNFKIKTTKFIISMDNYYEQKNILMLEIINQKFLSCFYEFIRKEISDLCLEFDKKFYEIVKNKIFNNFMLLDMFIKKLSYECNIDKKEKINNMINKLMLDFSVIKNILKLFYNYNKDLINYEDHLILNIKNANDIKSILKSRNGNIVYYHKYLPNLIIERNNVKNNNFLYFIEIKHLYIIEIYIKNTFLIKIMENNRLNIIIIKNINLEKIIILFTKIYWIIHIFIHPKSIKIKYIS